MNNELKKAEIIRTQSTFMVKIDNDIKIFSEPRDIKKVIHDRLNNSLTVHSRDLGTHVYKGVVL